MSPVRFRLKKFPPHHFCNCHFLPSNSACKIGSGDTGAIPTDAVSIDTNRGTIATNDSAWSDLLRRPISHRSSVYRMELGKRQNCSRDRLPVQYCQQEYWRLVMDAST
jgi:hypothetical protein